MKWQCIHHIVAPENLVDFEPFDAPVDVLCEIVGRLSITKITQESLYFKIFFGRKGARVKKELVYSVVQGKIVLFLADRVERVDWQPQPERVFCAQEDNVAFL